MSDPPMQDHPLVQAPPASVPPTDRERAELCARFKAEEYLWERNQLRKKHITVWTLPLFAFGALMQSIGASRTSGSTFLLIAIGWTVQMAFMWIQPFLFYRIDRKALIERFEKATDDAES